MKSSGKIYALTTVALITFLFAVKSAAQEQPNPKPQAQSASSSVKNPLIIPQPKSIRLGTGTYELNSKSAWTISANTNDVRLWQAAESLLGKAGTYTSNSLAWVTLRIGSCDQTNFPAAENRPKWASDIEGYRLIVAKDGTVILASTTQGAFYGLQTLAQLLQSGGEDRQVPVLEIDDWPALRFRGAHWFPSASGVPMHQKLIQNVFAPFKFNQSVIQCEAAKWFTHPDLAATNSIAKADLKMLIDLCRTNYIEPTPLINVPGHAEWVFRHGQHLNMAEDPAKPYAICVLNPHARVLMVDVFTEVIHLFQPKFVHLGHDEITMRGRFPNPECPRCANSTVTQLMLRNANWLTDWIGRRKVKTMLWGDMLLAPGEAADATHAKTPEEAAERRAGLSRKATIVDWHYAAKADAQSLEIFKKAGFQTIAATWYTPDNIWNFSQAAQKTGAEGLLQTTWMGYFPDETALQSAMAQFSAFILAAEYAWSGRNDPPSKLGYDPKEVFLKAYGKQH